MSALGDLLELLHDASSSFERLRGEFRIWADLERNLVARQADMDEGDLKRFREAIKAQRGGNPMPRETVDSVRLWVERPDRVREERESEMVGRMLVVQDGTEAWRYQESMGAVSQSRDELGSWVAGHEFESLLDPSPLMGVLTFEPTGMSERAGRSVWSVLAQPRVRRPPPGRAMALYSIGAEADEWHLEVDSERGIVVRLEARYQGEPMRVVEALELSFDHDFPPETFVFTPPEGAVVRPIGELRPHPKKVTFAEAVERATFTIFVPPEMPSGWRLEVNFMEPAHGSGGAVWLRYSTLDATRTLTLAEHDPGGLHGGSGTPPIEEIDRNGTKMRLRRPAGRWLQTELEFVRDDTEILIHSDSMDAEEILELAESLVPAGG